MKNTVLISSFLVRGQRWRLVALAALFFVAGCTVELYPPAQEVNNLPDGGKVDVLPDTIPRAFSFGPRIYWSQIIASDSAYSIAVTDANNKGRWLDSLRWVPSGPFVTVNGDTLSTRAYARDNSGVTGDNQVLTYNGSGSLTIESGNTVDMSDLLDNTDAQTIDTLTLQGDTMLQVSLSGDGAPVKELDLSALRSVVDSTRLTQDSIFVYYQDGAEVGRDTIAGVGGGGGVADNLGNHIATQNIQLGSNWLSNDGDNEGLSLDGNGAPTHMIAAVRYEHQTGGGGGGDVYENFFLGYNAGQSFQSSSTGYANTIIGRRAGFSLDGNASSSSSNVIIGYDAGRYNVTGSFNTLLGTVAGGGVSGQSHTNVTALGYHTARLNTGSVVTFLGSFAGENNTASNGNTGLGYRALRGNTTGNKNTSVGHYAIDAVNGEENTAMGYEAMGAGSGTGGYNTVIGSSAGRSLSSGNTNTLIGRRAGYILSSGGNNTAIGNNVGLSTLTTGFGNILIGYGRELSAAGVSNEMNIGNSIYGENINSSTSRIGINAFPNNSAVLDLSANTNSFIFPKGTYAQRPTTNLTGGMARYDTDDEAIVVYDPVSGFWNSPSKLQFIDTVSTSTTLNQAKEFIIYNASGGNIYQALPGTVKRWKWSFQCINCATNTVYFTTLTPKIYIKNELTDSIYIRNGERIDINSDGVYFYARKSYTNLTDDGSASGTTDGSGDITVSHTLGSASITVTATATGTTFYHVQVHSKTSTTFKIRFYNSPGSAATSTAVTADWIAKLQ